MPKRIYRSRQRAIAGVCGGIGKFFNIDPTIIRLIWALAAFLYGVGLLTYLICWLVIPLEPPPH